MMPTVVVVVSGGFDPIHVGHVRMTRAAKTLAQRLVVILNNDNWLLRKKGFVFMPQLERKEILEAILWVDGVYLTDHEPGCTDMSVSDVLRELRPDIFANGGDRGPEGTPIPEVALCQQLGIAMRYNIGGDKIQSSSWLTKRNEK
jgi:D-beta-D-heptose 7-phosphate kinase/D-beta-D-heptose 1-phosphate adenosyltransferase